MSEEEDARQLEHEMLVEALGEMGARGGRLGGNIGGRLGGLIGGGPPAAAGGESGGRAGARWTGKRLREDRGELTLEAPVGADEAMRTASEVLAATGEPVDVPQHPEAWAIVGSGFKNMNPAVTRVAVEALDEGRSRVTVRAVAKEGLIKQRGGQKAAQLVHDRLADAFG